jgi:tRNA (cmo5U34)-methyltransferase
MKDNTTAHAASDYDSNITKTIPYYEAFHAEILRFVQAIGMNPRTWLDTGCGTGVFVDKAREVFPDTDFVLVDPSMAMLEEAREKLQSGVGKNIRLLEPTGTQDIPATSLGQFDVITAIQAHHYLDARQRKHATKKCFELLRSGGLYFTFENTRPATARGIEFGKEYWKKFQEEKGRNSKTVEEHISRFDVEYFPITLEGHLGLLRETGFQAVEAFWYSYMQSGYYCIK